VAKSLYYRIGQACKELDIQPYVLRYWETEFTVLSPDKSKSGQRVYSEEDLRVIRRIKELLYDEGFTIAGAKKRLEAELKSGDGLPEKKAAKKDPEREATVEEEPAADAPAEDAAPVEDSANAERAEALRAGVEEALEQSREILAMLDVTPKPKSRRKAKK
jgi:DNA-binding transcriptional MerR regulator